MDRELSKDVIVIFLVIASPFGFFLYLLSPNDAQIWSTKYFVIDAGYFEDIQNFLWIFNYKLLVILLISIWFLTCKNWWRLVVLIPLSFEIYKFLSFINDRNNYFSDLDFNISLFIIIPYCLSLFTLSKLFGYYSKKNNSKSELHNEINNQMNELSRFRKKEFKYIDKEFKALKTHKDYLESKEYLSRLIRLRDKLSS